MNVYSDILSVNRAMRSGNTAAVTTRQRQRLADLVSYARQHSPFYAEKYAGLPEHIEDVTQLPVVSKPELMPRLADWITDRTIDLDALQKFVHEPEKAGQLFMDRYLACTTSGTTGQPAVLLQDQATLQVMGALNILRATPAWLSARDLLRVIGRGMRTAAVWATGGHYLGIAMMRRQIYQKPARARSMRIFPVLSPLNEIVAGLNEFQPAMLNGYSSAILLLAQEQEAGRLHINPVLVMTSSESLSPEDRARVRRAFPGTLADNYGCSEFVAIAHGCREGWLHVHADWVILEPVDADLNPVPPGTPSQSVLLTNLVNRVQPVLRYNLGDRITLKPEPCPCGSPFPAIRVEGRTDEILRFPGELGQPVPVLPLALYATIKPAPGVQRFQVIQTAPAELSIRLEAEPGCSQEAVWADVRARLDAFLATQGSAPVSITLDPSAPARDPRSGKFRTVWSQVKG